MKNVLKIIIKSFGMLTMIMINHLMTLIVLVVGILLTLNNMKVILHFVVLVLIW